MASVSLLIVGLLALAAHQVMCQLSNSDDGDNVLMEQEELFGLFEVMGSILDDPTWAQMHPQPCTDTPWPGVECEVGEDPQIFHVTKIHVGPDVVTPPCKASAKIPESLVKLPHLKTLSLFNCFTTSQVSLSPSLFGALSSLEHLALVSNPSLSGAIPPHVANILSLKVLCLSQNNLHGEIPKEIGGLVNLEQLDLSYNNLSGSIPEEIGGFKSLTILDLGYNHLQGKMPSSLGQLELLQKIDMSSNNFQGRVPSELGKLKKLVLLDLSHNSLNGPITENLASLEQLQYFMIEGNPINTCIPSFIGALVKLTTIAFPGCGFKGPIPTSFSNLKNLTALSLDNNSLNGTVPPTLSSLPNLDLLNLSQNQLTGELLFPEEFINRLGERLDVRGNLGLCTTYKLQSSKNISSYLSSSSCLSTKIPNCNKTLAEENPSDSKRMRHSRYQGNISSTTHGSDRKLVFPVLFFLVLLFCSS